MALIAGVDGCPTGWLCLSRDTDTKQIDATVFPTARDLFQATIQYAAVTIDIPIGLPSGCEPRECDVIARRLLGPGRASSVFPAPVRAALGANSWEEACRQSEKACGKSMSRQSFAILDRIQDVDDEMRRDPSLQSKVREIHPEVCFYFLNGKAAVAASKKSLDGAAARRVLIEAKFGMEFDTVRRTIRRWQAADDDIMDAFAALWTAARVFDGEAVTIPADPPRDACGLRMEMLA
jgi:predicted RNase H-like nuclease